MEPNNYNGVHILSEAVIMGGISMYFYKKISELETTIEDLKKQITMQNNQIRYILGSSNHNRVPVNSFGTNDHKSQQIKTPLIIPTPKATVDLETERHFKATTQPTVENVQKETPQMECEGGVCRLVPKDKKVVISKISKQIEFDRENFDLDQTRKVNTFTNSSPNPVLKSVTPKPSTSISEPTDTLEKILNDIDDE